MNKSSNPMIRKLASALSVAALSGALLSPNAHAALTDFETIQSADPNLVFQYKFEGGDDSTRLADGTANGYTLQRVAGSAGGSTNSIQFLTGFDGNSQAYKPAYDTVNRQIGAGLITTSTSVPLGASVTVEAIVQLDELSGAGNATNVYILSGRPTSGRAYFLKQVNDPVADRITSTFGSNNNDQPAVLSYATGNWYYLVVTASYDGISTTTVNWYGANLTAGETNLQHYGTSDYGFSGDWTGNTAIGLGCFNTGIQEYMNGMLDNVALTGTILATNDLQTRLNALYVAPACVAATILADPVNASVPVGNPAAFSISAVGLNRTYQWQLSTNSGVNWNNVSSGTGGTTATYTTAATALSDSGNQYRCLVNVACDSSSATSAVATLTVTLPTFAIWTGAVSTDWNTASNWNTQFVPSGTTAALIPVGSNVNFTVPAPSFGGLTNQGLLTVSTNGLLNTGIVINRTGGGAGLTLNEGGVVNVTGTFGICSNNFVLVQPGSSLTASAAIHIGSNPTGGASSSTTAGAFARMTNNGGTITTAATTINSGNATVSGNPLFVINGGINNLGAVDMGRPSGTSQQALGTEGLMIYGGQVSMTSLRLGNNNFGSMLISPGAIVTNTGNGLIRNATANRASRLLQTGGTYVTLGVQTMTVSTGTGNGTVLSVTGGTNLMGGLEFGGGLANPGTANFTNAAAVYIGASGIANSGSAVVNARLNPGGLLGATADWTGSAPMILGAGAFTFRAASLDGTPHNILLNGVLSGTGPLVKTGAGTLTMDTAHTYSAATLINEGTLALGASGSLTSSDIIVASGALFDVSATSYTLPAFKTLAGFGGVKGDVNVASTGIINPGTNGAPSTLTFSNALTQTGGAVTHFDLSINPSGPNNDLVVVHGDLNVSGLNTLDISGGGPAGSVHPLFKYHGNFNGDLSNFEIVGASGILTNDTASTPKVIALITQTTVRGATNIVWVGNAGQNDWDLLNLTNWLNNASLDFFVTGDAVTFNAAGAANPNVNIPVTVQPGSVRVDAATDYTFSGVGAIAGSGTLTKTNSGRLTLVNNNLLTGGVNFHGGTVSVASLAASGDPSPLGSSGTLAFNGGTLEYTGADVAWTRPLTLDTNGGALALPSATLTQDGSIGGTGALTKTGNGTLVLNTGNSYSGGSVINAGTLTVNTVSGAGSGAITLNAGTLAIGAVKPANSVAINGPGIIRGGNGSGLTGVSAISGSADFTLEVTTGVFDLIGSLANYSGTVTFSNSGGAVVRFNGTSGSSLATFDLGEGTMDLFVRNSLLNANIGGLKGGVNTTLSGRGTGDNNGPTTHHIGANGQSTTFEGIIRNGSGGGAATTSVVKTGGGKLTLTGGSTYTGTTTVSNGVLQVNGSLGNTAVTVEGGTLAGTGSLSGSVTVNSGGNLAPGASIGTLYINNSLTLNGTFTAEVNTSESPNADLVANLTSVTYGGTLVVSNLGPALTLTDAFPLFSAGAYNGAFAAITPFQPAPGLYWDTSTLTTDGTLRVTTTPTVNPNPTNITSTVSGTDLTLSWPESHKGWTLQAQTNSRSIGLTTNGWFDVPNSAATNQVIIPMNKVDPTVFYRLRLPQ